MTRRLLLTLVILAGLAAAPSAQPFSWQAGGAREWNGDTVDRSVRAAERVAERMARVAERVAERMSRQLERAAERAAWAAERSAARVETRLRQTEREVRRRANRAERMAERATRGRATRWMEQGAIGDDPCRDMSRRDGDDARHCEVREQRLPAGALTVDAGPNGGIRVEAWDGSDILVRAVVQARGDSDAEARQRAAAVVVEATGNRVSARGPSSDGNRWWSVSYRVSVPRQTDLQLNARNGGITIVGVAGAITFDTTNGGVRLADIGGRVNGRTRNGGVNVALGGSGWEGEGLDVETSNGGVTLAIPESYNAQLETRTVNGGFRFDYPLTLTGELTPRRGVTTTLGAGGAPIRARTTNGGVRIERR